MTKTRLYFVIILFVVVNISFSDRNVCLQCDHVPIPKDCTTVGTCRDREDCYAERFRTQYGVEYYNVGCRNIDQCAGFVGRRRHIIQERLAMVKPRSIQDTSICHACCHSGTICNVDKLCGAPTLNKLNGTICYQCSYTEKPEDCHQITLCRSDEICTLKRIKSGLSHRILYQSGCEKRQTCAITSDIDCCERDLCNNKLTCQFKLSKPPRLNGPYIENGDVKFRCSFDFPSTRTDVLFNVTWTVDGLPLLDIRRVILVTTLQSGERSAFLDVIKLAGNLNKMLRCKVEPFCLLSSSKDDGLQSNGYWVGIKVSPQRIHHTRIANVTIESTLPFLCPDGTENNCSPEVTLKVKNNSTTDCRYKLLRNSNGRYTTNVTVRLRPHSVLQIKEKLEFKQVHNINFPAWNSYYFPVIQIGRYVNQDAFRRCEISEQNVKTLSSSTNISDVTGYLLLYKHHVTSSRYPWLEVQVKRIACGRSICTCAVVVREGNSAVQIDVCGQAQIVPNIKYLSPLSQKEIFIDQSNDGLNLAVTLLTGSTVDVNISGQNMQIGISIVDDDLGLAGGICGQSLHTYIGPVPIQSMMIPQAQRLFDKDITFDVKNEVPREYCSCSTRSTEVVVQCNTDI